MAFRTLDNVDVAGKRVLLRADLNVPVRDGKITDLTRIERLTPTIRELVGKGAKVIVCSHFDRPKGKRVPEMSLAPMAAALGEVLGQRVRFAEDCIGVAAAAGGRAHGARRCAGAGEHPLSRRGGEERSRLRRRAGEAGRHLRERRVLRRASRACQHRGRGASAAGLCRPADAGRTGGAGRGARQPGAAGRGDRRRRQGVHQAGSAGQPGRQGERAGDRRRDGQHVPGGAGLCGRPVAAGSRDAWRPRATSWRSAEDGRLRGRAAEPTPSWRAN